MKSFSVWRSEAWGTDVSQCQPDEQKSWLLIESKAFNVKSR